MTTEKEMINALISATKLTLTFPFPASFQKYQPQENLYYQRYPDFLHEFLWEDYTLNLERFIKIFYSELFIWS